MSHFKWSTRASLRNCVVKHVRLTLLVRGRHALLLSYVRSVFHINVIIDGKITIDSATQQLQEMKISVLVSLCESCSRSGLYFLAFPTLGQ